MHLSFLHTVGLLSFGDHCWVFPSQPLPAHFTAPPRAGWASPAVQGACGQHPVGLPVSCPPPARPCCCLGAQWPRVHTEGTARLGKAERSVPAVPPSICCRGQPQAPYRPERDELQAVFGKVEELLAFPCGWTAPSWSLSSRLGPGPATVAWLLPRAAGLVLAPPWLDSSRMGILIVGAWETPLGWSQKALEQVCFLSWEQHSAQLRLCMAFYSRWARKTPNSFYYIL